MSVSPAPRRGRPPSLDARQRILTAAAEILLERGDAGLTVEGVAARAKVGKPTIYRSWPNARALAMAALLATPDPPAARMTGSALADLRQQLTRVAASFASRRGRQAARMLSAADDDSDLARAFRSQIMLRSREEGRALLIRAVANGELPRPADIEVTLDMIYGPVFYRLLIGHAPLDRDFTDGLLDLVFAARAPLAKFARREPNIRRL